MKKIITIVLFFLAIQSPAQSWPEKMAATVMTIWKDSMAMQPDRPVRWAYDQGVVLKGIEGL